MSFTEQDKENCIKFGSFVAKHAKMDLTVSQIIEFSKLMVWYNSLPKKIEDNMFEIKSIKKVKKESK